MLDFTYKLKGLGVTFINISDDYPTPITWSWSFGDGSESSEENPSHTYETSNFYRVTLKVLDDQGSVIDSVTKRIVVSDLVKTHLSDTIYSLINAYIPESIFGSISPSIKQQFIVKWQLYLQPLVNHEIPLEEYANELYYEALENQLIMELAAYDYMVVNANQMIAAASSRVLESNSTVDSETEEGSQGSGSIKKITTGPTEVEYFDNVGSDNETITSIVKAMQPGGILDVLRKNICMLADRLTIYLPICNRPTPEVVVPKVVNRREPRGLDGPNPPIIVNK